MASASPVSFYTAGSLACNGVSGCSGGGNSITVGGITITFAGVGSIITPVGVDAPDFGQQVGTFTTSGSGTNASFTNAQFSLTITQTVPTGGVGSVNSNTLTGTLSSNTGNIFITFNTGSNGSGPGDTQIVNGGLGADYQLEFTSGSHVPANSFRISSPVTPNSTLLADITPIPEPSSMLLFGTGLTGLAGVIRRRLKK